MTRIDIFIIVISLFATGLAIFFALRNKSSNDRSEAVAGRSLGSIVLALGAGATANSGFVLTGAVGLGYSGGLMWCLLPLGWLIGDIFFWTLLARKVYVAALKFDAVTLPELIKGGVKGRGANTLEIVVAFVVIGLMTIYVTSQWLSTGKVGGSILGIEPQIIAFTFAAIVIAYTALGGVRGAAYTDFVQACFMLTLISAVFILTLTVSQKFKIENIPNIPGFLSLTGSLSPTSVVFMVIGFAILAIGFNLGQPQMVNRWMSAKSEKSLQKAKWIYIAFVQVTWLSYTALGALFRLAIEVQDPEQALVAFVREYGGTGMLGLLIVGAISTIASTASATIATCVEILKNNIINRLPHNRLLSCKPLLTIVVGFFSLLGLTYTDTTVFSLAITAVSLLGAALAAPVLFSITGITVSAIGTVIAVISGLTCGFIWIERGLNSFINEAAPGMIVSIFILLIDLVVNRNREKLFRLKNPL